MSGQDLLIFVLLGIVAAGYIYFHFVFSKNNNEEKNNQK